MSIESWIQRWKVAQVFFEWQTLIAGVFALLAGLGTVAATMIIARRQIDAGREDADKVVTAAQNQTAVAKQQIETTVRLEQDRVAGEANAFHAMLEAAMARVLAEAAWAKKTYPHILKQKEGSSVEALAVRECITKGAFAELRAACVRQRSPLTFEFLDLEREIDNFAMRWRVEIVNSTVPRREGMHAGLSEQLGLIETRAAALREKAVERI